MEPSGTCTPIGIMRKRQGTVNSGLASLVLFGSFRYPARPNHSGAAFSSPTPVPHCLTRLREFGYRWEQLLPGTSRISVYDIWSHDLEGRHLFTKSVRRFWTGTSQVDLLALAARTPLRPVEYAVSDRPKWR